MLLHYLYTATHPSQETEPGASSMHRNFILLSLQMLRLVAVRAVRAGRVVRQAVLHGAGRVLLQAVLLQVS